MNIDIPYILYLYLQFWEFNIISIKERFDKVHHWWLLPTLCLNDQVTHIVLFCCLCLASASIWGPDSPTPATHLTPCLQPWHPWHHHHAFTLHTEWNPPFFGTSWSQYKKVLAPLVCLRGKCSQAVSPEAVLGWGHLLPLTSVERNQWLCDNTNTATNIMLITQHKLSRGSW